MTKITRSLLFVMALFVAGTALTPLTANAQHRRYHHRHHHHRPNNR